MAADGCEIPTFEMVKRKQSAVVGRKAGEERLDLLGGRAGGRIGGGLNGFGGGEGGVGGLRGGLGQPASADGFATTVIAADVDGHATDPVGERLLRSPARQGAHDAEEHVLHKIVEVGVTPGETPKQAGDLGLMAADELVERGAVALPGAVNEEFVGRLLGGCGRRVGIKRIRHRAKVVRRR